MRFTLVYEPKQEALDSPVLALLKRCERDVSRSCHVLSLPELRDYIAGQDVPGQSYLLVALGEPPGQDQQADMGMLSSSTPSKDPSRYSRFLWASCAQPYAPPPTTSGSGQAGDES